MSALTARAHQGCLLLDVPTDLPEGSIAALTMPFLVHATGHARRQIGTAGEWWLANRDKAPELFVSELEAAHVLLAAEPGAGAAFPTPRYPGARRLLMGKTRYHVYQTVHDEEKIVLIRAVWHASRGRVPALR